MLGLPVQIGRNVHSFWGVQHQVVKGMKRAIGGREVLPTPACHYFFMVDECDFYFCGVLESHPSPLGATSSHPNGRLLQPL